MKIKLIQIVEAENERVMTLNNVAVEYFEMGLPEVAYQIWVMLYEELKGNIQNNSQFRNMLPIIICNMGHILWKMGHYEKVCKLCCDGLVNTIGQSQES